MNRDHETAIPREKRRREGAREQGSTITARVLGGSLIALGAVLAVRHNTDHFNWCGHQTSLDAGFAVLFGSVLVWWGFSKSLKNADDHNADSWYRVGNVTITMVVGVLTALIAIFALTDAACKPEHGIATNGGGTANALTVQTPTAHISQDVNARGSVPDRVDIIRPYTELLAFIGAALFFGYKFLTGYFIVNAELSGSLQRAHSSDARDALAVAATFKRGDNGSLQLHDARARVSWGSDSEEKPLIGIDRLVNRTDGERQYADFNTVDDKYPFLSMPTNEAATFSAFFTGVPREAVCVVEIAVTGRRTRGFGRPGQWRTSLVSLPIKSDETRQQ